MAIAVSILVLVVASAAWLSARVFAGLPDAAALRGTGAMSRATTLFDARDQPVFTIFKEQRIEVPLSRISPHLIHAVIAVEDQRFFDHGGIDPVRMVGAAWTNLRHGWGTQGASTITQQFARQSFFTREKTLTRKLKEIVVAARLERTFTKDQILEMYLNKVYFGDGLYGAEAASLGYFGKHASDLDVAEAALLAGLVKAPSSYAPTVNLSGAVARRNAALAAMREADVIDEATLQQALGRAVRLHDTLRGQEGQGQYFKEEVRKLLVQQFGWERVYAGGLKVYTTLDLELQKAAEAEVDRAVAEIERRQTPRDRAAGGAPLQAALVALDPKTGEVRAMVGGRSFDESRFNRVTQARRQAGSAFKPFVYAAALEQGYSPASLITELDTPVMTPEGAWVPADHSTSGAMTMRAALRVSSNRAAVRMLQQVGIPAALKATERLGIASVPGVPSLALGSGEVTLLSMTVAYAAFANSGMRPTPLMIRRVETTEGEVLFTASASVRRAVSEATAFLMTTMLADVVNGGTGWQVRRVGFTRPAAGKTGTTNDYRDAWFVGYTPHLATGVWVGYDQPRPIIASGYAGTLAAPLWGRFMAAASRNDEPTPFRQPRTVTSATICRLSGKLATEGCRGATVFDEEGLSTSQAMVYAEYFTRGTEPADYCHWHTGQARPVVVASAERPTDSSGLVVPRAAATKQPDPPRGGFLGWLFRRGSLDAIQTPTLDPAPAPSSLPRFR